jgi:hypothetical protein
MDLLDALGDARQIRGGLDERRADRRALGSLLDVLDEMVGHRIDVSVLEVERQVVEAEYACARDDANARCFGDPRHEANVASRVHRRRVDDRLDAM